MTKAAHKPGKRHGKTKNELFGDAATTLEQSIKKQDFGMLYEVLARQPNLAFAPLPTSNTCPLLHAAELGLLRVVQWLLKTGFVSHDRLTTCRGHAANVAAREGHLTVLQWLGDPYEAFEGWTPFDMAIKFGHLPIVKWYLTKNESIGVWTKQSTPLGLAVLSGHVHIVEYLVKKAGCSATHESDGVTPMMLAAGAGRLPIVQWFVREANVQDSVSSKGLDGLAMAAAAGHTDVVKWLVDAKANIDQPYKNGEYLVNYAIKNGRLGVVKYLVSEHHAVKGNENWSCLAIAAEYGQLEIVEWLVMKFHMNVDQEETKEKWTALLLAIKNNHNQTATWLIEHGANPEKANERGWTPLCVAIEHDNQEMMDYFLSPNSHANINHVIPFGCWSPLLLAVLYNRPKLVPRLVQAGAFLDLVNADKDNSLLLAADGNQVETVKYLLEAKAAPNERDNRGLSVLGRAASRGHVETVSYLVGSGYFDVNEIQNNGKLPLELAIANDHVELVRWLVTDGRAEVNGGLDGCSLLAAIERGNPKITRALIAARAKLASINDIKKFKIREGLLCASLDKVRLRHTRVALYPFGFDKALTALISRYATINLAEATLDVA